METNRRLAVSVLAATALFGVATVGLASVPPRPLRSALTIVHTLSLRVATDWLVVVALLAVGERFVSTGDTVDRWTVASLATMVFVGSVAIEASPLVRHVAEPATIATESLVRGLVAAFQRALFGAGLFVATAVGAGSVYDVLYGRSHRAGAGGLPLAPTDRWLPTVAPVAVARAVGVLVVAGAFSFLLEAGTRLSLGEPYSWLVLADAGMGALGGIITKAVLAIAFLALLVEGVELRSLLGGTVVVWATLFASGILVAVVSALVAITLVSLTTTPMPAVEAAALGRWPAPDSWAMLLHVGTFLAGAVGLLAVQRRDSRPERPDEPATGANEAQDA